jgi:hypothetical protein
MRCSIDDDNSSFQEIMTKWVLEGNNKNGDCGRLILVERKIVIVRSGSGVCGRFGPRGTERKIVIVRSVSSGVVATSAIKHASHETWRRRD